MIQRTKQLTILDFLQPIRQRVVQESVSLQPMWRSTLLVGAGGAGFWFGVLYALSMVDSFRMTVIDPDTVEVANLNRFPLPFIQVVLSELGVSDKVYKADLLSSVVQMLRPHAAVYGFRNTFEEYIAVDDDYAVRHTVVVDAVDNPRVSTDIKRFAAENDKLYLGIHYDGDHLTVECFDFSRAEYGGDWVIDEEAGYRVFPSVAYVPVVLAALGIVAVNMVYENGYKVVKLSCSMKEVFLGACRPHTE